MSNEDRKGQASLREERFIIKVVEMHYKQGLSQQEIGKKLNVSRTTISRALAQAKKQGYVQIKINYPEDQQLILKDDWKNALV